MPTRTSNCLCGSTIKLTTASQKALDGVMALWWREHQGDGHGPTTAAVARQARDKTASRNADVHEPVANDDLERERRINEYEMWGGPRPW